MASPVRKRRAGRSKPDASLVSRQRKKEVLGLIFMVMALLIALAVLSYDAADNVLARRFSIDALIEPGTDRADNALGLFGASIAYSLVPMFIGYCVLLIPGLMFGWGYVWFRNKIPVYLPLVTVLTTLGAFLLSALFGWIAVSFDAELPVWHGSWGFATAGWMQRAFGTAGSFVLLMLTLAVTMLLLMDHDIQRSLDRFEEALAALKNRLGAGWLGFRERRTIQRTERKRAMETVREERSAREVPPTPPPASEPPASGPPVAQPLPVVPSSPPPVTSTPGPHPTVADVLAAKVAQDVELRIAARVEEEQADDLPAYPGSGTRATYNYEMPGLDLLDAPDKRAEVDYTEIDENKQILLDKLSTYNIEITLINAIVGPTVTLYELTPAPGIKISRITALENDLAMALAARGIRMIAPIPGKTAIGVEIPNRNRELVRIREVIGTAKFRDARMELPLIMGKSIEGEVVLQDLTRMPHVLIAGATGSGKSVGLNTFIAGLLYACPPEELKFVMIDPKKIELQGYGQISQHYIAMPPEATDAIITDFGEALGTLKCCEREMETRYDLLSAARVRSVKEYNARYLKGELDEADGHRRLPYIVVVVDELADLMMTAGKDIEAPIARLAQMARAVGIHLILATQRPSVDVITGLIKANFPSRIAYQVASKIDSRTILDQNGAEGLVGNGDLLYMLGSRITRLQGPFVSIQEMDRVTQFIGQQRGPGSYMLPSLEDEGGWAPDTSSTGADRDDLFDEAAHIIVRAQQGSVSLLQRKLSVGYSRAARIVDQLEDAGIVGPFEGSKARQVRVSDEQELDTVLRTL